MPARNGGNVAQVIRRSRFLRCVTPLLALAMSAAAGAAERGSWKLRASAGGGFDSNAVRAFDTRAPDGFASVLLSVSGAYRSERWSVSGGYDGGLRKFMLLPSQDTLINSADGDAGVWLLPWLRAGLAASAKDNRGGQRDYTDLGAHPYLELSPDARVDVRLSGGARSFGFWPSFLYSFVAGELSANARYRFDRRHFGLAFLEWGSRTFAGGARPRPPGTTSPGQRRDQVLGAGAGYAYRGGFTLDVAYAYLQDESNSYGERLVRHRLTVTGGVRLPWRALLLAQGTLQLTSYPDGVYLAPEQLLTSADEENHSSLSLKLARPVTDTLDAELRYAVYADAFAAAGHHYLRHVAWLGFTFRL